MLTVPRPVEYSYAPGRRHEGGFLPRQRHEVRGRELPGVAALEDEVEVGARNVSRKNAPTLKTFPDHWLEGLPGAETPVS